MKYVVVIGGIMSGIGKGTLLSSIGVVLRSRNISMSAVKIDPYLNLDAGTLSPNEHGEVRLFKYYILRFTFLTTEEKLTWIWEIMKDSST